MLVSVPLTFPTAPLVTTIAFTHTTEYRQRIGRWREVVATEWTVPLNAYLTTSITREPVVFETVHAQPVVVAASIPVRLDVQHSLDLGSKDEPYYWELVDVGADRAGRILGLVAVSLTTPPVDPVSVPLFRLDMAGRPFVGGAHTVRAHFPANVTMIWALVDLGAGTIVAATAEPTVTIDVRLAGEGPPWEGGGASHASFPGIYRHAVTTYAGGPLAGRSDELVDAPSISRRLTGGGARLDVSVLEQALDVTGWFRPELHGVLADAGLGSFEAGEVRRDVVAWNYACLVDPCLADAERLGLEVVIRRGGLLAPPAELVAARRARPAPAGERLALLADALRTGSRPVGSIVAWDVDARAARETLRLGESFHGLGAEASTEAVLVSYRPESGATGTFLVPLGDGAPAFFPGGDLRFDFTVVGPGHLYSVRDLRFYRPEPPLRATPLPARLAAPVP
jgi:hypothetical protein